MTEYVEKIEANMCKFYSFEPFYTGKPTTQNDEIVQ